MILLFYNFIYRLLKIPYKYAGLFCACQTNTLILKNKLSIYYVLS